MIIYSSREGAVYELRKLRARLDRKFAKDTAAPGTPYRNERPDGHCAVVALLVHDLFGGELVSANVSGLSHWFNRLRAPFDEDSDEWFDVDLTGDQFYGEPIRVGEPNTLWPNTRARSEFDINAETRARYELLRSRLGIDADWDAKDASGARDGGGAP